VQLELFHITMAEPSGIIADDERLVFESSEAISVVPTFDQLGLKEDLLRGIYAYSKPTPTHCNHTKKAQCCL
jgi:hypothetical protein